MNMLILPGSASPDCDRYRPAYDLIANEANGRGYRRVSIAKYPGQSGYEDEICGPATLPRSTRAITRLIRSFNEDGEFIIIGRCFGCTVALSSVKKVMPKNLRKIILYAPVPFWLIWELYKRDFGEQYRGGAKKRVQGFQALF